MGVDVALVCVEQNGSSPRRRRVRQVDVVLDLRDEFARLCESSELPMLSRVDPYGTLKLGSREMGQFISEINAEFSRTEEHGVQEILQGVLRLARECQDRDEMELRLDGD